MTKRPNKNSVTGKSVCLPLIRLLQLSVSKVTMFSMMYF